MAVVSGHDRSHDATFVLGNEKHAVACRNLLGDGQGRLVVSRLIPKDGPPKLDDSLAIDRINVLANGGHG
jgi:hypothetical protein